MLVGMWRGGGGRGVHAWVCAFDVTATEPSGKRREEKDRCFVHVIQISVFQHCCVTDNVSALTSTRSQAQANVHYYCYYNLMLGQAV